MFRLYYGKLTLSTEIVKVCWPRLYSRRWNLSRSPCSGPLKSFGWFKSPIKSVIQRQPPNWKKSSEEEWDYFIEELTRQAEHELASSP
nr:hypothetical protein [Tanacetum cinerariifolium]